jgi:hypothetical protein
MEQVKFGFGQIPNTTPEFAKWIFRIVLYAAAVINLVILVVTEIPQPIKDTIARYSLEIVALVHGLSKMFGIDVEDVPSSSTSRRSNLPMLLLIIFLPAVLFSCTKTVQNM